MSKDRPRNRPPGRPPGHPPKSGFRSSSRPSSRPGPRAPEADLTGDSDKPWDTSSDGRPRGPRPGGAAGAGAGVGAGVGAGAGGGKPRFGGQKPAGSKGASPQRFQRPRKPEPAPADEIADIDGDDGAPWAGSRPEPSRGRPDRRPAGPRRFERREAAFEENGDVWIWGLHAVGAALANPKRRIREAILTRNAAQRLGLDPEAPPAFVKLLEPREIDDRLPEGAVHQGAGLRAAPLEPLDIADVAGEPGKPLVILDQLTDPQNVGAIFRSAAAFGFGGVVMQTRRAPALGGALAKAAAGGVEAIPEVRAVNLARAIDALTEAGWRVIGLDGGATTPIGEAFDGAEPLAIVLGAEGSGLRPAVANACTGLARIPMTGEMESLNVSNAAAIAFYQAAGRAR